MIAGPLDGSGSIEPVPVEDFVATEPAMTGGSCALDAVNGGDARLTSVKAGTEVWFSGWVADDDKQVPADALFVFRGEGRSYSIPVLAGVARPDVAKALSSEALATSGYNLLARVDMIPGSYALVIISGTSTAAQKECDLDARMLVVE
ncbi:hypothetical protein [Novilysobacter antarcticus]|uniref:hypothetical protein n=1 Tax=Novilysobacter antarcticus TaxID=2862543 RepID=UPI001C9966B3|nr:hypothetical protein [Lysobacter antarcticus]